MALFSWSVTYTVWLSAAKPMLSGSIVPGALETGAPIASPWVRPLLMPGMPARSGSSTMLTLMLDELAGSKPLTSSTPIAPAPPSSLMLTCSASIAITALPPSGANSTESGWRPMLVCASSAPSERRKIRTLPVRTGAELPVTATNRSFVGWMATEVRPASSGIFTRWISLMLSRSLVSRMSTLPSRALESTARSPRTLTISAPFAPRPVS